MNENEQRLEELRNQQKSIAASMNDLESKKIQYLAEQSQIKEDIAKLEEKIEAEKKLHDDFIEATKAEEAKKQETIRLNNIRLEAEKRKAEQLEAEKSEAENKKAKQEKVQTITDSDYSKMLANYNQSIKVYNNEVAELYRLQNLYEQGQIAYSTYSEYAIPLAEKEVSLKEDYDNLIELYNKLNQSKSSFEGLTNEQLNERLNNLSNEYKEKWSINNKEGVSITDLGKLNSDINAIKDEQAKRKNIEIAKSFTDSELSTNIHMLDSALKSGTYEQDSQKLDEIKSVLSLLNNEYNERKFKHLMNLTDEQLDTKLDELNEEYLSEWNYSAHEANGMEDNDISKLDNIKQQIDFLNAEKAARENGVITKSTFEMPKAPLKAGYILEKNEQSNNFLPKDDGKPIPETITQKPVIPETPAPQTITQKPVVPETPAPQNDIPETTADLNDIPQDFGTPTNGSEPVIDNTINYPGILKVDINEVERLQREQEEAARKLAEYNYNKAYGKWYQKIGYSTKDWFSRVKATFSKAKPKALTVGKLKDDPQHLENTDYDDSDMKTYKPKSNPYFKELQNYTPDDSSKKQVKSNTSKSQEKSR